MVLFFCHTRKTLIWRPEKGDQVARIGGRGGGYLIWAMPERKRAFPYEVFPYSYVTFLSQAFRDARNIFESGPSESHLGPC